MNHGFIYARWLLLLTFCCLLGLLAVGMVTVHSKRTIRTLGADLDRKESQFEELGRRQDIVDTELAGALNPEYLKQLIAMSNLRLGPPKEDRIIIVQPKESKVRVVKKKGTPDEAAAYRSRLEIANLDLVESD